MQTLLDLKNHYLRLHAAVELKPSTREGEEILWRGIFKILGEQTLVASITKADIMDLKSQMCGTPVNCNRTLALLSHAFNLAEDWEWRPSNSNPVRRVKRYKERPRTRLPSVEETQRLVATLYDWKERQPWFVGMILLLILTGCRRGEIQNAKREWVQGDRLVLPDSKTGAKIVPLNSQAQAIIAAIPKVAGNPYLIVGRCRGKPLVQPNKLWKQLCKEAGVPELNMHDLRRLFASVAISSGRTLEQTMQLMGHTQAQTTKRYAFLMSQQKMDAMQDTGDELMRWIKKGPARLAG
jgi:integrase